jgi:hypothetical protein
MPKIQKNHVGVLVEKNAFVDDGDGVVTFPKGLVITDDTEQRNGTKYDIKTMELGEYQGQMTADHMSMLDRTIAGVEGLAKVGNKVVITKINYLVNENPLARLAYNLLISPKIPTNFSIETYGPWPDDEDRTYYNSKLIGLSQVVVGNNKSAKVNSIVLNSIEESKKDGLDTTELEKELNMDKTFTIESTHKTEEDVSINNKGKEDNQDMTFVTIKNGRDFAVKVKYKNVEESEVENELAPGATLDISDDQQEAVENQIKNAEAPKAPAAKKEEKKIENKFEATDVQSAIEAALKPFQEKIDSLEQNAFDSKAVIPEFKKALQTADDELRTTSQSKYTEMSWQDRHAEQINSAWNLLKKNDQSAAQVLNDINEVNLAELKKDKVVKNSMSISDFGNFVISRELLTEIAGCRNDYTPLIDATTWKETLATQFAWLKRSGDISMEEVEFCDDDANGNLKPISKYGASIETANLMELAAVTPVCNAATRFLAADLLGDVAEGYRNDYDRKRAQLVVARLEQAIEENGNSVIFDTNPNVEALVSLLEAYKQIANCTPNGTFVMNTSSHVTILEYALRAGINGPLSQIFVNGTVPTMFGRPYIVVSDDLMPSLDSAGTVTITVEGQNITVNHAVFYGNLSNFTGRTSGGLMYDLSTEAAYEDNNVVKSAFQRNELVLRGSFFRGGAIKDTDQISGIASPGVS